MSLESKYIYTMSSNASIKYIRNIMETLSLPSGYVNHFRYQLKWVDPDLRNIIPRKDKKMNKKLRNIKAIMSYLYQKKIRDEWKWNTIFPFRSGTLIDAYKTGDEDTDIIHLYIKIDRYILYEKQVQFTNMVCEKLGNKFNKYYASCGLPFEEKYIASIENSKSAFNKICEFLDFEHFKSPEGKEYYPIFCFIEGLKDRKSKSIQPEYDPISYKSYYEIGEASRYSFGLSTYFPQKPPEFIIKLLTDEKIFSTPSKYELRVASRYDEESYNIISSILERDIWTAISIKTELLNNINDKEPLNLLINFPVKVKRIIYYRIIDVLSDIGFGVGTGSLALKAALPKITWWLWPFFIGYVLWIIFKLIIKTWRG